MDAGDIDPLPVLYQAAVFHQAEDIGLGALHHLHADQAVVQHDLAAHVDILGRFL